MSSLVTLDGKMQDPGGFGELAEGGWAGAHFDEEAVRDSIEQLSTADIFLCGRVTFEKLSEAWSGGTGEYLELLNNMATLVASTTLSEPLGWNASLIKGHVAEEIAKLKQQPGGDIVMYGSATLTRTLAEHDLIDVYKIAVHPMILGGSGKRLFDDHLSRKNLRLVHTKQHSSGLVSLTYEAG